MDAKLHGRQRNLKLENRLPGRHVTAGIAGWNEAPQAGLAAAVVKASGGCTNAVRHLSAIAPKSGVAFDLVDGPEVFKRTPYIADLKPAGRFVAKDLVDVRSVPLLTKTLLDNGFMLGDCMTVTGCAMAGNLNCMAWNPDRDVVRPADQDSEFEKRPAAWQPQGMGSECLWKYAQEVGPARHGAVTHPVGAAEKACYADI
jgi:dihydroxyacid dehydratase/phosphogluconate dehydratase